MYSCLVEFLCKDLPSFASPIVGVVYYHLASSIEKIPDKLFTTTCDLLSQRDGLFAFLTCWISSDSTKTCRSKTLT